MKFRYICFGLDSHRHNPFMVDLRLSQYLMASHKPTQIVDECSMDFLTEVLKCLEPLLVNYNQNLMKQYVHPTEI